MGTLGIMKMFSALLIAFPLLFDSSDAHPVPGWKVRSSDLEMTEALQLEKKEEACQFTQQEANYLQGFGYPFERDKLPEGFDPNLKASCPNPHPDPEHKYRTGWKCSTSWIDDRVVNGETKYKDDTRCQISDDKEYICECPPPPPPPCQFTLQEANYLQGFGRPFERDKLPEG